MEVIRKNVFETNSSSCHSAHISDKDIFDFDIGGEDGIYEVECDEFGWGYDINYDVYTKLSYLCTALFDYDGTEENVLANEYRGPLYLKLKDVVKECTGKEIVVNNECGGYVDHQSYKVPIGILEDSPEKIKQFLFNLESYIEINNDNSCYNCDKCNVDE